MTQCEIPFLRLDHLKTTSTKIGAGENEKS